MTSTFWDTHATQTGPRFIGTEEKNVLLEDGTPFEIHGVTFNAAGQFGDEYVITLKLDGEMRKLSFGTEAVESRDQTLADMQEYFTAGAPDGPITAKLGLAGRSQLVLPA